MTALASITYRHMKIKIFIAGMIMTGLLSSLVLRESIQNHEAEWLVGTWENKTSRGSIYESWKKIGSNELRGKSYILRDQDTVIFENIQIIKRNSILNYIPTANGQNNDQPVAFPLKSNNGKTMVFENPAHDFPQIISYTRISVDSLFAEISGTDKGKVRKQGFPMKRIK